MMMYGTGMGDCNAHDPRNIPLLLAGGGAGQLKGGRHIRYPKETPLANLHLTLLDKLGVHAGQHRRQHRAGSTIGTLARNLSSAASPAAVRRLSPLRLRGRLRRCCGRWSCIVGRQSPRPTTCRLIDAVKNRDVEAVQALLKQRVDVNAPQGDGATALHWAAHLDDLRIADC